MKVFLALVLMVVVFGILFFPSLGDKFGALSDEKSSQEKCTAKDGKVYYGNVPESVVCLNVKKVETSVTIVKSLSQNANESPSSFGSMECDGRKYCSQMRSCSEAEYFLKNCPNTSMDGNNDGIPCQKQWCNF